MVSNNEFLTRYLLSKRLYNPGGNRVKYQAFMPPLNLQLSVFRINKLSDFKVWRIGEKKVAQKASPPRNLHGRADIQVSEVLKTNLGIITDIFPHRHANIIDWPNEKSERMEIALELAEKANLKTKP